MKLSLRNLLGRCTGRSAARNTARQAEMTRLKVERLEERAVPAVNLLGYYFALPNAGTLHITSQHIQNNLTETFKGTFTDSHSGIVCQVSGQCNHVPSSSLDQFSFHGSGGAWLEGETVQFSGWLFEVQIPHATIPGWIEGRLTENYVLFISPYPGNDPHWSTTSFGMAYGEL
jgi:hypothetical protein